MKVPGKPANSSGLVDVVEPRSRKPKAPQGAADQAATKRAARLLIFAWGT